MRSKPAVFRAAALILFVSPLLAHEPSEQLSLIEALRSASAAGEHEKVVELASRIVTVNPDRVEAWYLLGRHAEPLGRHELVIASSKRAWDHGYRFMPWIAVRIARAAAALDERELAYEWLRKALEAGLEDRQEIARAPGFAKYLDDPEFRAIAATPGDQKQRAPGLRRDIDLLVEEAQRLHAHPDRPAFDSEFLDAAEALKRLVEDLDDAEVVDELRRLTAILDDGHTVTYGAGEGSPLEIDSARLPVRFYLFDEGMFVIESYDPRTDWLVGSRVVAVGRRSPGELLDASRELHGSDNPMTMMWMGPQFYFSDTGFLRFADAIDDPAAVVLSVERPDGEIEKVHVEPGDHPLVRKLRASAIEGEVPLYLRYVDRNYWLQALPDHSALYFQFNQVRDDEEESIEELAGRLRAGLSDDVANLIVDVRHNNGGNNGLLRPLLREIVAFDSRPGTRVFVITGRNTFSAAQNFINRVERMTDAVFVGEPSSSSPNFTGEETMLVLPWSRVMVSISSNYWQDSDPGDQRPWVSPHISIPPTASDYFAGRDAALEAILEVLGQKRNAER